VNLLMQIPLVGIFVWFILERDKRMDVQQISREEQWREFIKEQREQNNAAIGRLAEEIKCTSIEVSRLNGMLSAHDAASRERMLSRER